MALNETPTLAYQLEQRDGYLYCSRWQVKSVEAVTGYYKKEDHHHLTFESTVNVVTYDSRTGEVIEAYEFSSTYLLLKTDRNKTARLTPGNRYRITSFKITEA